MKQLEPLPSGLHVKNIGEAIVICPEGACDEECTEALESIISQIESKPQTNIILDASKINYIETSGFRWIINQFRKLQEIGGSLIVAGLAGPAERAFKLLQLDRYIPAAATVEAALARVRKREQAG
ncbi:MAG: STAS domain-containing protein [Armatimonadota bacterium]